MKRAIIVHGWGGSPTAGWIPWLKKELETKGIKVIAPQMPNTEAPEIQHWLKQLKKTIGKPDKDTYLIGHSIGCQTILRYLEQTKEEIGGVLFVAGWLTLKGMASPEEKAIAKPWLETPINLTKIKTKVISIFSDDDPYVPENNWQKFKELGEVIIENRKGHIEGPLASILKSALELIH